MENLFTQKNLERLLQECYKETEQKTETLRFEKDKITIKSGTNTSRILGNCKWSFHYDFEKKKRVSDSFVITIFKKANRDEKGVKETILHELIHTLPNCQNHRNEFKYWCSVIKRKMGYNCLSGSHEDCSKLDFILNNYKYFTYCPNCKMITDWSNRQTKSYKYPFLYKHNSCNCEICSGTKEDIIRLGIKA